MRVVYNIFLSVMVLGLTASPVAFASRGSGDVKRANDLYKKGRFDQATEHYQKALMREPQSPAIEYDLGTALYKKRNYAESIEHLNKALLSDDPELQNQARYNLGNALYKSGIKQEKSKIDSAIASLEKSLLQYQKVLSAVPKDADAQFNYEFIKKELERLKQKKEEQKNQSQQDQNQQKQKQPDGQGQQNKQDQKDQKKDQQSPQDQKQDPSSQQDQKQGSGEQDQQSKDQPSKDQQSKDQKSKDQKDPSSDQKKNDQQPGGEDGQESSDPNQDGQPSAEEADGGMTPKEANMVLGDYERNEEPKGMLYFVPQSAQEKPVAKDW